MYEILLMFVQIMILAFVYMNVKLLHGIERHIIIKLKKNMLFQMFTSQCYRGISILKYNASTYK